SRVSRRLGGAPRGGRRRRDGGGGDRRLPARPRCRARSRRRGAAADRAVVAGEGRGAVRRSLPGAGVMRLARMFLLVLCALPARGAIVLAGEAVRFDPAPQFTLRQLRHTAAATRAGLARWAATEHGRQIINALASKEYDVIVLEDDADRSAGSAPQPALATLVSAGDHSKVTSYVVVLNPTFFGAT